MAPLGTPFVTVFNQRGPQDSKSYVFMKSLISTAVGSGPLRAERRRREVRHEIFTTPELVTARRSILGPPAEGQPGTSIFKGSQVDIF